MGIEHFNLGTDHPEIGVKVQVTNAGQRFSGREVVQVYVSCPQGKLPKEYRRLAGFQKTRLLAPGEMEEVVIRFSLAGLSSYRESLPGWVLEEGTYGIFVGNSLDSSEFCGSLELSEEIILERTRSVCPLRESLQELCPDEGKIRERARGAIWEAPDSPSPVRQPRPVPVPRSRALPPSFWQTARRGCGSAAGIR